MPAASGRCRPTPRTTLTLGATLESQDTRIASAILRLGMDPSARSHHLLADAYRQAGVTDYAYKHWRLALRLDECDSRAWEGLARLWRDWGSPELALSDAHRAVYCKPDSASAHNTLGTILEALGQRQQARQSFEFALRLDAQAGFALNNLCYLALQDGDGPGAQAPCTRALAIDANDGRGTDESRAGVCPAGGDPQSGGATPGSC